MMKFLYILLLIAAAFFYPLYQDNLSFIILVTLIILPIILLCQLIISAAFLKCEFTKNRLTIFRNGRGELQLKISNRSVFPLANTKIRIKVRFSPTGSVKKYTVTVPLPALRTETVSIGIDSCHCGAVYADVEYVKIYDLLKIFSVKRFRHRFSAEAAVIPQINPIYAPAARLLCMSEGENTDPENQTMLHGEPDEITGFREYLPGDRLSLIHYKLSARFDKDIVKIMSSGMCSRYLLTVRLDNENLDVRDRQLEKLMSCAYYMNSENAAVYVLVPDSSQCEGIYAAGGLAAYYCDDASYFAIARSLCESSVHAAAEETGFIVCNIEDIV